MNKYGMVGVCLLAALGALLLEVTASPSSADSENPQLDSSQLVQLSAQFLPSEYRKTNVTIDDIKRIYRAKCKKVNGADDATFYEEIERAAEKMTNCVNGVMDMNTLKEEMDKAKPEGELDTVFSKYCQEAPKAVACVKEFNEKAQHCLIAEEKRYLETVTRIGASVLGFACSGGGNQIALFIAEQGPECLNANNEAIGNCFNQSFHQYIPKDGQFTDVLSHPELLFSPTHCVDLQRFESCVVHHLEQCTHITTANIAQSVFKFVKNETDCLAWMEARANEKPILMAASSNNTATGLAYSLAAPLLGATLLLMRP